MFDADTLRRRVCDAWVTWMDDPENYRAPGGDVPQSRDTAEGGRRLERCHMRLLRWQRRGVARVGMRLPP